MLSMFVMIVLSNITYRFGISAVWLNGIERGIRYLVECPRAGSSTFVTYPTRSRPADQRRGRHFAITAAVIAMFLVVDLLGEEPLGASWGIDLRGGDAGR